MSKKPDSQAEKRLRSLEEWRDLRLDIARSQHEQARAVADERQKDVDAQQLKIDASHEAARAHMETDALLSVDTLTGIRHFTVLSLGSLQQAQTSLQQAQDGLKSAHDELIRKSVDKRAVERLREKRNALVRQMDSSRQQNNLDDQAAMRYARARNRMPND